MVASESESVRIVIYPYVDEANDIKTFKYCLYHVQIGTGFEDRMYESPPIFSDKHQAMAAGRLKLRKILGFDLKYIEQHDDVIKTHILGVSL